MTKLFCFLLQACRYHTHSTPPSNERRGVFVHDAQSMKTTMQAVGVIPMRKEVCLIDHEAPRLTQDHHVKVRVLDVGICGTDREICTFVYGRPPSGSQYLVLRRESLGQVTECGAAVQRLKVGDLVLPSVRRPCPLMHCRPCRADRQDFCATVE